MEVGVYFANITARIEI